MSGECVLTLDTGVSICTDTYEDSPDGSTYVRVVSAEGDEVAYWTYDEWAEDPMLVMGATLGAAKGGYRR